MSDSGQAGANRHWMGLVQPVGCAVSVVALERAGLAPEPDVARFRQILRDVERSGCDAAAFFGSVLGWERPPEDEVRGIRVTLAPERADLEAPQLRLEMELREAGTPGGLLFNGRSLRLVSAPRGEAAGHLTFDVSAMCEAAGQPILAAMRMLLAWDRLEALPALLVDSRRYHEDISTKLSDQVVSSLHELLAGFQGAGGAAPTMGGLLSVLMRLVFLLYAEDRGLLGEQPVYRDAYSVAGLFRSLERDRARYPDTMDDRVGAWARLLSLFRLVHEGARHQELHLPAHRGRLFDPEAFGFLEGHGSIPRISDGAVARMLEPLLVLDGDRVSYRSLDVEQIGSVYESLIGFSIEVTKAPSVALRARRKPGAPPADPIAELPLLLAAKGAERIEALADLGVDLTGKVAERVRAARSEEELAIALAKKLRSAPIPPGQWVLQPTLERRRSGSHYTPRALTEPVVMATLRPLIDAMGPRPRAERILSLKVCDPAMGSGAFLVAACRVLGEAVVAAWVDHGELSQVPEGQEPVLHARRLVAERCLYGVDKNPFAVDLAKLSLWLVTFAKGRPFAFLDHALKRGDSLVGFEWALEFPEVFAVERGGLDAFIGNPPWVSYAGRAAQPLDEARRRLFAETFESFAGYRNLQGVFIERCANLLRPGGRLGLIIPSSMSEQEGYGPTRLAHDRLCECDEELTDLGEDSFRGVFQPSMVLRSTRRLHPLELSEARPWPIERPDLDDAQRALIAKLGLPPLPAELFGERGLQTSGADLDHLEDRPGVALRSGGDIRAFQLLEPSHRADAAWFGSRLRAPEQWRQVRVLIRQTAAFPIAALSDGQGFRNSLLAGFADAAWPAAFLVAYLNSTPVRWLHFVRHRDARQGMPQMKIGHLRTIPAPPRQCVVALAEIGHALSSKNEGLDKAAQDHIDAIVAEAFGLNGSEAERLRLWANR